MWIVRDRSLPLIWNRHATAATCAAILDHRVTSITPCLPSIDLHTEKANEHDCRATSQGQAGFGPHHLHRHEERPRLRRHQADGRKGIGALLVVDGDDIAGIVTERDYARKVVLQDRSSKATRVEEIMTAKVRYVEPSQSTDECMALMTEHRMRHLPVLDGGKLVGLISIGDLVKSVIADQQFTISQLEHYIHGTPAVTSA